MNFFVNFFGESPKKITEEAINDIVSQNNRRICFSRNGFNPLWSNDDAFIFVVKFKDSINRMLNKYIGYTSLQKSKKGNYYTKVSNSDIDKYRQFVDKFKENVFIRDLLDVSMALSFNMNTTSDGDRTTLGQLEYEAKYQGDQGAKDRLVDIVDNWLSSIKIYKDADMICAVPSSKPDEQNLPQYIIDKLTKYDKTNISNYIAWRNKEQSLKNLANDEKLNALEKAGIDINGELDISGKRIVLLDDLYQSGQTMMYVAMKLKEAGASEVYGLAIVKSLSDN